MSGMLLFLQGGGRLVYIIPLPITMFSPGECGPSRHYGVPPHPAGVGSVHYIFQAFSRVGDPVLYVIYGLFCTEYELICSFDTFIRVLPNVWHIVNHYILPRRVRSVTSLWSSPASRRRGERSLYISGVLPSRRPRFVRYLLSFLYGIRTNLFI